MRPPEFTGGNSWRARHGCAKRICFNEAAGIHRRKPKAAVGPERRGDEGFNEAAGIHRRKLEDAGITDANRIHASMRPPEFTGGNSITVKEWDDVANPASMRPPEFTGGNH